MINKMKKPTIQVNLWEGHTLFKIITLPAFVTLPGILIIGDEYYYLADHLDSRNSANGDMNYIKTRAYKFENISK